MYVIRHVKLIKHMYMKYLTSQCLRRQKNEFFVPLAFRGCPYITSPFSGGYQKLSQNGQFIQLKKAMPLRSDQSRLKFKPKTNDWAL